MSSALLELQRYIKRNVAELILKEEGLSFLHKMLPFKKKLKRPFKKNMALIMFFNPK